MTPIKTLILGNESAVNKPAIFVHVFTLTDYHEYTVKRELEEAVESESRNWIFYTEAEALEIQFYKDKSAILRLYSRHNLQEKENSPTAQLVRYIGRDMKFSNKPLLLSDLDAVGRNPNIKSLLLEPGEDNIYRHEDDDYDELENDRFDRRRNYRERSDDDFRVRNQRRSHGRYLSDRSVSVRERLREYELAHPSEVNDAIKCVEELVSMVKAGANVEDLLRYITREVSPEISEFITVMFVMQE